MSAERGDETARPVRIVNASTLTANERAAKMSSALKSIAELARVCASNEAPLSIATLRAAMDDIAIYAERMREEERP